MLSRRTKLKEHPGCCPVRTLWRSQLPTMASGLTKNTWIGFSQCFNASTDEMLMKVPGLVWQFAGESSNAMADPSQPKATLIAGQPSSSNYLSTNVKEQLND